MRLRNLQQPNQPLLGLLLDRDELLAPVRDFQDRRSAAGQAQHLVAYRFQDAYGQDCRPRGKVVQAFFGHS